MRSMLPKHGRKRPERLADAKILDCGCGGGANIRRLLKKYPQSIVKDVDYSAVSV